jgi:hypothetical protein
MATPPPVLIVIDLSTLIDSGSRAWPDYSRVGSCYLPQVIYDEIGFLSDRAPEPNLEQAAREFLRFFPNSSWQLTNASASHPALTPPAGKTLSKQARQSVAVVQCVYGLSQEHPGELVVLVSNAQQLLKSLPTLQSPNLCGITAAALLQWARTGQKPPAVTQQMQAMIKAGGTPGGAPAASKSPAPKPTAKQPQPTAPKNPAPMAGPASAVQSRPKSGGLSGLSGLIGSVLGLVGLAIAGGFAWRTIQPASFNQFWHQMGLPALPGQPPAQKPKPANK